MKIEACKLSVKGSFRTTNQDRLDYLYNEYGQFLAILCDGMGGHAYGEVAAQMAVDEMKMMFLNQDLSSFSNHETSNWIELALLKTRLAMQKFAKINSDKIDMGTTLIAIIIIDEKKSWVVNIGDSRIYNFNDDKVYLLSTDQNLYNSTPKKERELINEKNANSQNFNKFHYWKILTSALGPTKYFDSEIKLIKKPKGYFLLTSDGVHDYISKEKMSEIIFSLDSLENKAKEIVDFSENNRSTDNLSLVLFEVTHE